jgi:2-hydroxychromene-2-carboxylate isomerase
MLRVVPISSLQFFFDYLSPYAYFAALELPAICDRRGARLVYRPVLFAALLDHWGQRGPAEIPAKALYTLRDCARYAAQHHIPFRTPRYHPFRSLTALRVSLELVSGDDQRAVVEAIYRAGWGEGADLGSGEEIAHALDRAGLDGQSLVARAADPDVKVALREETERAVSLGVFGIPTMVVNGELFWGKDRLADVDEHLAGNDPLATVDISELFPIGVGAVRPGSKR